MTTDIFVSYRRLDSQDATERISRRLKETLGDGSVFRDVDSISPGIDFRDGIARALEQCSACLVVIGKGWLAASNENGRRLDDPEDPVHVEIAMALGLGIPVVPILVGGQPLPRPVDLPAALRDLSYRQSFAVRVDEPDFQADVEKLGHYLRQKIRRDLSLPGAGIIAFCFAMFFLGGLSLALPYYFQTSQPWRLVFGDLQMPFKVLGQVVVDKGPSGLGWIVELGRSLVLMTAATFLLGVVFPREFSQLLGREAVEPDRRAWLTSARLIAATMGLLALVLLLFYHLDIGPRELSGRPAGQEALSSKLGTYEDLFIRPFAFLLIYSTINVLIVGVPLAATVVFACGMDINDIGRDRAELRRALDPVRSRLYGPEDDRASLAFQLLGVTIADRFGRYCAAIFWMTILIAYELQIGRLTSSSGGWLGMFFCYFMLGVMIAIPTLGILTYWIDYLRVRKAMALTSHPRLVEFQNGANLFRYLSSQVKAIFYLIGSLLVIVVFYIPWGAFLNDLVSVIRHS